MPQALAQAFYDYLAPKLQAHGDQRYTCEYAYTTPINYIEFVEILASQHPQEFRQFLQSCTDSAPGLARLENPTTDPSAVFLALIRRPFRLDRWTYKLILYGYRKVDDTEGLYMHALKIPFYKTLGAWCQAASQYIIDHVMAPLGILPEDALDPCLMMADYRDLYLSAKANGLYKDEPIYTDGGKPLGDSQILISDEDMSPIHRIGILAHELIHAVFPDCPGHKRRFVLAALRMGLTFRNQKPSTAGIHYDATIPHWACAAYSHAGTVPHEPDAHPRRHGVRRTIRTNDVAYPLHIPACEDYEFDALQYETQAMRMLSLSHPAYSRRTAK